MKKFSTCTIFALVALCFTPFIPMQAHAGTVTLELEGVGGANSGGVYTYPYYFSINGSSTDVSLMCFAYQQEIYVGETWTATVESINSNSSADDRELAYLYNVANDDPSQASAAQWAAWELFDPSLSTAPNPPGQTAVDAELTAAASFIETANPSYYNNVDLYIPVPNSQNPLGDGLPQSFIGDPPPVPEPSGLVLLGTGLLLSAVLLFRQRRVAPVVQL